jgi:phytoene dehydrogenase-like protein
LKFQPGSLPAEFTAQINNLDYSTAVTKINVALNGLPNFTAHPNVGTEAGPQHRGTIHICKDLAEIEGSYVDAVSGKPSERPIIGIVTCIYL